jgi:hypothetical protein
VEIQAACLYDVYAGAWVWITGHQAGGFPAANTLALLPLPHGGPTLCRARPRARTGASAPARGAR